MSHPNQLQFVKSVKEFYPHLFTKTSVLEIGSLNINGSVRQFFEGCNYLGVDLGPGLDVDMVCQGHLLPFTDDSFDVVISCECLEHDKHWAETFKKMCALSKNLVIMTCATIGRAEHGTFTKDSDAAPFTNDHYRNLSIHDFVNLVDFHRIFKDFGFVINSESHDIYFWGKKQ